MEKELYEQIKKEGDLCVFQYKGYTCMARRRYDQNQIIKEKEKYQGLFHWCGYVGVTNKHKFYLKGYDDVKPKGDYLDVHGGLTFTGFFDNGIKTNTKDVKKLWFIGFDCAHAGDTCMCFKFDNEKLNQLMHGETYKDLNYVIKEIKRMVNQLD